MSVSALLLHREWFPFTRTYRSGGAYAGQSYVTLRNWTFTHSPTARMRAIYREAWLWPLQTQWPALQRQRTRRALGRTSRQNCPGDRNGEGVWPIPSDENARGRHEVLLWTRPASSTRRAPVLRPPRSTLYAEVLWLTSGSAVDRDSTPAPARM